MSVDKIYACVDYEDDYVQPLILAALKAQLPQELLVLIENVSEMPAPTSPLLQWRQYESIDFDHLTEHPTTSLANSYIIRKALIRKHYLSSTISHWLTKHPDSILKRHVQISVEFELDYAEFLDDALVEAFELHESWTRNVDRSPDDREWWILKPGMSERGQGIRLFSTEEELTEIFEQWDPPSDEEEDEVTSHGEVREDMLNEQLNLEAYQKDNGVITSQLRHFIAQPYISRPLLIGEPHPSAGRKFHIRTYILALGALKVYVYRPMLALFAGHPYLPPSSMSPNANLGGHLTNTCLQNGEHEGSVQAFWSLPSSLPKLGDDWREGVFKQICDVTAETFEAAARSMSVHFQVLPNAFEIFGLDFLVDESGNAWLLEVNAFPDFRQTGHELQGIVEELVKCVVDLSVDEFFRCQASDHNRSADIQQSSDEDAMSGRKAMVEVLNIDLGRR